MIAKGVKRSLRIMRAIIKRTGRKLKSRAGESIAETLVALLISALALVMLAGAISATARMITTSDKKMEEYYNLDDKLVRRTTNDGTLNITITLPGAGASPEVHNNVKYYKNDAFASKPVVAYGQQ